MRDKSRSVNSIDIVFNFDCVGFTGTPFIDNYPTFAYISSGRSDAIPQMIDRSFYAYSAEALSAAQLEARLAAFQGKNGRVLVQYRRATHPTLSPTLTPTRTPTLTLALTLARCSDFVQRATDERLILHGLFAREDAAAAEAAPAGGAAGGAGGGHGLGFNVLVDLCGIFKKISIHQVRDIVRAHFGPERFQYVYHIEQSDGGDRVLDIASDGDVQFDEELYKQLQARGSCSG